MQTEAEGRAARGEGRHRPLARLVEIAAAFGKLGCTSFGGPIAHLGYIRAEVVDRRRWLDDAHYADVVALCQFLPGPASSQTVFAVGMHRAGLAGAIVASLSFTLPSALLMIGFAIGLARLDPGAGWLHGLRLAAVAVVAQAVWGMGTKLCPDRARVAICFAVAATAIAIGGAYVQLGGMACGALAGWWLYRGDTVETVATEPARGRTAAALALIAFAALLVGLPLLAAATDSRGVAEVDAFYRAGALVFGGGHVVLPLLRSQLVPRWISDGAFLAGYGGAQAVPGPLFTFAAYLGATMHPGSPWLGAAMCLLSLFLPGWLLVGGALPFWRQLRGKPWARAALAGANAAVVGVLLAALYDPLIAESVRGKYDVAAALLAFAALHHAKAPPWLVVLAMAGAGQWLL